MGNGAPNGTPSVEDLRVVVAHDFMETFGGAERVTSEIAAAFPDAPVVAITGRQEVARRMGVEDRFRSLLRPRQPLLRHYRLLAPLFPAIAPRLRLPEADVVLSSSYAFAHHLGGSNGAIRICYSYSPLRFAWSMREQYREIWAQGPITERLFDAFTAWMRRSDRRGARGVFRYLAPGPYVAQQIRNAYGRESDLVPPPVDCDHFRPGDRAPQDYFLFAGRLIEPYKRVTMLVEAFNRAGDKLIIAGDGPERTRLQRLARPNIEFVGQLEDDELIPLMQECKAAIFPSQDDFGLIPVEVNACGRPVIASAGGGDLHTVLPGVTGEFFRSQTADAIETAIRSFEPERFEPAILRQHALKWRRESFRERLREAVLQAKRDADNRKGVPPR